MNVLFIIPARGGSKGLPGKNILSLGGKPMIAWSIHAVLDSGIHGDCIVSTNDKKIAKIANSYGANIPFMRPQKLATDKATTLDVIIYTYNRLIKEGKKYTHIAVIQPTSPLRKASDIVESIKKLSGNTKAVIGVTKCDHHPLWSNQLPSDLSMKHFIRKELLNKNRQQLPEYYQINGAIYISEINYFLKNKSFFGSATKAYIMPTNRSVDIDTEKDFVLAEYYLRKYLSYPLKTRKSV